VHLLAREVRTIDDEQGAVDLGHTPADVVLLSFSDSDLGAAAAAWLAMGEDRPTLRLANLARLRHPMSVDLYVEQVIAHARCVVLRLLGGLDYWPYGAEEVAAACRASRVMLAVVPGDARDDPKLLDLSTAPVASVAAFDAYLRHGGPANLVQALRLAAHLGGVGVAPDCPPEPLANVGEYILPETAPRFEPASEPRPASESAGLAVIVFYRSHLLAGDIEPVTELAAALRARGLAVRAVYVSSLKDPDAAAFLVERLRAWRPAVVLSATAFSAARRDLGSPLDAAGVPVLQLILAGCGRDAWEASSRGLSQADLAMQVVLPEIDGRILAAPISFKADADLVEELDFVRVVHRPDPDGIALTADRALGWARLAARAPAARRVAIVLSNYPGADAPRADAPRADAPRADAPRADAPRADAPRADAPRADAHGADAHGADAHGADRGQIGHAVGLDSFASLQAMARDLSGAGYDCAGFGGGEALARRLSDGDPSPTLDVSVYRRLLEALPSDCAEKILAAWGEPEDDPAVIGGAFRSRHARFGNLVVAVQPDRGSALDRKTTYHDPDLPPRHGYVAFYLWLRHVLRVDAVVQLGTHGTLEWLPGKAVALSASCFPAALIGGLPVIYPFIVNNPGEAAAAKRRIGAVTIGHLTPPLKAAGSHGAAVDLERLIDEFAAADGLDRRRAALLRGEILRLADSAGLLAESGVSHDATDDEALVRLDAYLCDVKEMQIRDGLHVFGRPPAPDRRAMLLDALRLAAPHVDANLLSDALTMSAPAERAALLDALDGRMVAAGPAGAPTRGRADVLPTGRNLFTIDPRAVPTRSALILAERAAKELMRRHRQDHGEYPRALVIDLWGSASMRTGGEDFALALVLIGARPLWDAGSARVSGIEVLPLAVLEWPRVDVTLRISGLFRDAFEAQIQLFDTAVRAVAARDEAPEDNPLAAAIRGLDARDLNGRGLDAPDLRRATLRVFGAAPGSYGAGVGALLDRGAWRDQAELAAAYLAASGHAYGKDRDGVAEFDAFAAQVAAADAFVHQQDHAETDLLDSPDYAAHEGGFAAASASLGGTPALYHTDTSRPEAPRVRELGQEIARVVRARAANPAWIAGMMRHGYRGAAEIARSLDGLHAFAATLPRRLDAQFDLLLEATLADPGVDAFLRQHNPAARTAMAARFQDALDRGLWRPRRNAVAEVLAP
jgi:cobaltochelatase CobN